MTLSKLSWRTAQRQARDYLVYFVTVVMAAALIYAFNGLVFSQEIAALSTQMRNLPLMIVLASLAVVAVVGWLVSYTTGFMLTRRSRELGTYLLIGLEPRQVARLFFLENLAVGAVALAACMAFFGQLNIGGGDLAVYTAKVAAAKNALPWMNAFVLGIFCNLMVCIAVYQANTAQDTAGKVLAIFFPIMGFVLAGFEHCVADMYYVPAGIFAYMNPAYTGLIDAAGINVALLNFGDFIFANLIPVTLGNIVGGVAVGLVMYACHGTKRA